MILIFHYLQRRQSEVFFLGVWSCRIVLVNITVHKEHVVVEDGRRGGDAFAHRVHPVIRRRLLKIILLLLEQLLHANVRITPVALLVLVLILLLVESYKRILVDKGTGILMRTRSTLRLTSF